MARLVALPAVVRARVARTPVVRVRVVGAWLVLGLWLSCGCQDGGARLDGRQADQTGRREAAPPAGDRRVPCVDGGCDGGVALDGGRGDAGPGDARRADGLVLRHYTFRAIAGVSMGASAASFIGSRHPERFDIIGSLGGYINLVYFLHMMRDRVFAGFCAMEQILANLAQVNDPLANPDIFCGPVAADQQYQGRIYEWSEDFNHWQYSDNGGRFNRDMRIDALQDLLMAVGNPFSYNPKSPLLPAGVDPERFRAWRSDRNSCQPGNALTIDSLPATCNREHNPDCGYPLILFCDGEEAVGCYQGDPNLCGERNPEYDSLQGVYDPYSTDHDRPLVMAAVDYNRNRMRDFGEPVVRNTSERFADVGADGCADALEDGSGGCCSDADLAASRCSRPFDAALTPDPNRDNYDWLANPGGGERNWLRDDGEPFEDFGLDGVQADAARGITADFGEGNGAFDYAPAVTRFFAYDIAQSFARLAQADPQALARLDLYFDGGIRDVLNSAVGTYNAAGRLRSLGLDLRVYDDFFGQPTSILPQVKSDADYLNQLAAIDLSPNTLGKNVLVLYGNPFASAAEIEDGDGAHVGTATQMINRLMTFFAFVGQRWPQAQGAGSAPPRPGPSFGPSFGFSPSFSPKPGPDGAGADSEGGSRWYYSPSLGGYRRFAITLPPGYADADSQNESYPVLYLMHGYGQSAADMAASGALVQAFMGAGIVPKMILVFPDGTCCHVNRSTGSRECACASHPDRDDAYLCVDAQGVERTVAKSDLPERECNRGSFYLDMLSDKYASPDASGRMKYEGAFFDLMELVEQGYRARAAADVWVSR